MESTYIGNELTLFQHAKNWKHYWYNSVKKFISGNVLEVGAGIGTNSMLILNQNTRITKYVAVEPDKILSSQIKDNIQENKTETIIMTGYLQDLSKTEKFDTILYIDVIEHIEKDYEEIERAKCFLKKGGYLIILVPAYNILYSPFDKAIGHYRRYEKQSLSMCIPKDLLKVKLFYLDSLGAIASLMNKTHLKQSYPSKNQILFWDRFIVPFSKITDKIVFNSFGKSLIGIWQKQD